MKRDKDEVEYSKGMQSSNCGICVHYQEPGACVLVQGVIRKDMWCKLFEPWYVKKGKK
jgi:hypothetical protein